MSSSPDAQSGAIGLFTPIMMARQAANLDKLAEAQSTRRKYRPDNMMPFLRISAEAREPCRAHRNSGSVVTRRVRISTLYADALAGLPDTMDGTPPMPVPQACPVTIDELPADPPG